jgi:hypothetical protein
VIIVEVVEYRHLPQKYVLLQREVVEQPCIMNDWNATKWKCPTDRQQTSTNEYFLIHREGTARVAKTKGKNTKKTKNSETANEGCPNIVSFIYF